MSKGRKGKRKGGSPRPAVTAASPAERAAELRALAARIGEAGDAAGPLWGDAHRMLVKAGVEPGAVGGIIARRDLDAIEHAAAVLLGEEAPEDDAAPSEPVDHGIPAEDLKKAMRAFRKRLRLTRLDHESRLSVSPLTSGKSSDIRAIMAPRDFSDDVWAALVAEGRLRRMGSGFYELGPNEADVTSD